MDDRRTDKPEFAAPDLRAAIRVARIEEAERTQATAEIRGAELARLEMLEDALAPVFAQVPGDVEMFDCGLVPGAHPRLFIDMIAFVEMAHDKRVYRLMQSTRYSRAVLAESDRLDAMVEAVTAYVARRLVDREKALASVDAMTAGAKMEPMPAKASALEPVAAPVRRGRWLGTAIELVLSYLGIVALCVLLVVLAHYGYDHWLKLKP